MSKFVDASTVSPDTTYKSLVIENEKLKKLIKINQKAFNVNLAHERKVIEEERAKNEKLKKALEKSKEYLFYIAKAEKHCDQEIEKCYCERNSAQIALKEIEEVLNA